MTVLENLLTPLSEPTNLLIPTVTWLAITLLGAPTKWTPYQQPHCSKQTAGLDLLLILPTSLPFLIIFPQDWLLTTHNIICYLYVHLIPWECEHHKGIDFVLFVMGFTEFESRAWTEQALTFWLDEWINPSIKHDVGALEIKIHLFANGFAIQTIFLAI